MYLQAIGNIIFASLAIISNFILICGFLLNKRRRRTYPLLLTLALGDAVSALGFLGYGANRLQREIFNDTSPNSAAFCLSTVYPIVTPLSQMMIGLITIFIAIDRLIAMRFPHFYFTHAKPAKYYPILGSIISLSVGFSGIGIYQFISRQTHLPWHCGTPAAVSVTYNHIRFGVSGFGGVLASLIYVIAMIPNHFKKYRQYSFDLKIGYNKKELPSRFVQRQSRMTRDVSYVMASTLLLYATPMILYWMLLGLKLKSWILLMAAPYAGWLTVVHSTLNVALLCCRSRDIRMIVIKTIAPLYCWRMIVVSDAAGHNQRHIKDTLL